MKNQNFGERLTAAKEAKQAMAAKFRQRPGLMIRRLRNGVPPGHR